MTEGIVGFGVLLYVVSIPGGNGIPPGFFDLGIFLIMRKWIVSLTAVAIAGCASIEISAATTTTAQAGSLSWRFAGVNALKGKTNLVALREIINLPEFEGFRTNLTERIAVTLAEKASLGKAPEKALLNAIRPLTGDLIAYETLFETGDGGSNICSLAIQLPAQRHEVWKENWDALVKGAKVENAKLSREGDWTFISNGTSKKLLEQARKPATNVFQYRGDAGLLRSLLPHLHPDTVNLAVRPNGEGLRTDGKIQFAKNLEMKMDAWQIPTNTIRNPEAFTAARGVAEKLKELPGFKERGNAPDQLFVWSETGALFSLNAAAKLDDPQKFAREFGESLLKRNETTNMIARLEYNTNTHALLMIGLPIAVPFVRTGHTNDGSFVFAGLIPMSEFEGEPLPAGLANQLRPNVVYYDWEVTRARIRQWRTFMQLWPLALRKPHSFYDKPADAWLTAAAKALYDIEGKTGQALASTTEITKTGELELNVARQSNLGLSALELFKLVSWVSGPPDPTSALSMPLPGAAPAKP